MNAAKAILMGSGLIAASIVGVALMPSAQAAGRVGPFALESHSNPTASPGVFRVDATTGEVSYCYVAGGAGEKPTLSCLPGVQ